MTYIDVHCHIDLYEDKVDQIVDRAKKHGVGIIVNSGENPKANRKCLELAEKYPEIKATMGIYPIDAIKMTEGEIFEEIEFIRRNKDKIIAISEIGMDFKEDVGNRHRQRMIFRDFIELGKELDLPVIVHSRKAEKECVEVLEELEAAKVVMHVFNGKFKLVERIVENGWYLSIPAIVKYGEQFQKIAKEVPITQLLCETDSPFLHPDKERYNEPAHVVESYKKIAELKGMDLKAVEKQISENYKRLFG